MSQHIESKLLNEFFDLMPFNLSVYGEAVGLPIRSSEKIVTAVKEFTYKHPITKSIAQKIEEGLDKKTIIVGYSVKPISFFWKRLKHYLNYLDFMFRGGKISGKDIITLGFYDPASFKVIVLLDDNVNIIGKQIREIPVKLTHELCHYCADINFTTFLNNTMNDSLLPFYKKLLMDTAPKSEKINDSKIKESIKKLSQLNEGLAMLKSHNPATFSVWARLLNNVYNKEDSIKITQFLAMPYYAFITDELKSTYIDQAMKSAINYYNSYDFIYGLDVKNTTIPGQEFRFPSEVTAVSNEFEIREDMLKVINSTPMKENRLL